MSADITGMTEDEKLDAKIRQQVMESQRAALEYQMQCDAVMRRQVFAMSRLLEDGTSPSGKSYGLFKSEKLYTVPRVCRVNLPTKCEAGGAPGTRGGRWFEQALRVYEDQAACNMEYSE